MFLCEFEFNKMFANDIFVIQKSKNEYLGSLFELGKVYNEISL